MSCRWIGLDVFLGILVFRFWFSDLLHDRLHSCLVFGVWFGWVIGGGRFLLGLKEIFPIGWVWLLEAIGMVCLDRKVGENIARSGLVFADRDRRVRRARDVLAGYVRELADQMGRGCSENLKRYLECCARFHRYSFGNLVLALSQRPGMTRIAGIRTWNRLGRRVRAGERGIMILAPVKIARRLGDAEDLSHELDLSGSRDQSFTFFKPVYVFDVAQTVGADLPRVIVASGDASRLLPVLREAIMDSGIRLEFVDHVPGCPGARGASYGGRIVVCSGQVAAEECRGLLHEWAHELLHWSGSQDERRIEEAEADAVAFVVCRHFGLDCDAGDYLLLHDVSPRVLLARLERIRLTGSRIIGLLEKDGSFSEPE